MSRWIDADAIKDKAWKAESEACFCALEDVISVTDIDEAPSIDIVRCGECKHCSKDRIKWSVKDKNGNWIDTKCNLCRRTKLEVSLDDFCSHGEREGK